MESISALRIAGFVCGLYLVCLTFLRFRQRKINRIETVFRWLFAAALLVVCLFPDSVNFLRALLSLESNTHGRLIALLIVSNLLMWLLLFRERGKLFTTGRNFDRLVRSLATESAMTHILADLPSKVDILVVLPAFNEGDNIASVLARMPKSIDDHPVTPVVIDDGSDDGTREVVLRAGFHTVSNPIRRGQGAALRLGYDLAERLDANTVVTIDADGQHQPEEVERLVRPILAGEKDFVIGSRLLGQRDEGSRFRMAGIHLNNLLINFFAGAKISDCSSGFKAIRVSCLKNIDLTEDQFQAAEAIISAAHSGLRIGEVPITVKHRLSGHSKKGRDLRYGVSFVRTVFKAWWR